VAINEKKTGHSNKSFTEAAKEAAKEVDGTATFKVVEFGGEISANPGTINRFMVTIELTSP
jgi:flavin-binding protein dodecin